jgi:hypothetical protein
MPHNQRNAADNRQEAKAYKEPGTADFMKQSSGYGECNQGHPHVPFHLAPACQLKQPAGSQQDKKPVVQHH